MKKTIKFLFIVTIILCLFTGCTKISVDEKDKIEAPKNRLTPIIGKYETLKYDSLKEKSLKENKKLNNYNTSITAEFSNGYVRIGDKTCENPKFKIKTVDINQYIIYAYKKTKEELGITKDRMNVISISSNGNYFCELLEIDVNNIIINFNKKNIHMKKISDDEVCTNSRQYSNNMEKEKEQKSNQVLRTNLLLGLRGEEYIIKDGGNKVGIYTYRTISIYSKDRNTESIIENKNLLVPRKNGFWIVKNNVCKENSNMKSIIESYMLDERTENSLNYDKVNRLEYKVNYIKEENRINFISDDYLGVESCKDGKFENSKDINYGVFSLDSLNMGPLSIWNIIKTDQLQDIASVKKSLELEGEKFDEYNFTMKRRNGYWAMIGKTYKKDKKDNMLSIIPCRGIVNYDNLVVSWNDIKAKVPLAQDAYTSPNEDLLVVLTKKSILIYTLEKGKISSRAKQEITLNNNEISVMCEWATGSYADEWMIISKNLSVR